MRLSVILATLLLVSCATEPSHEGFVNILNSSIGRPVDSNPLSNLCAAPPIEVKAISIDQEEYRYVRRPIRNVGACAYSCEVNKASRLVTAVRVDGSEKDCVQFP